MLIEETENCVTIIKPTPMKNQEFLETLTPKQKK